MIRIQTIEESLKKAQATVADVADSIGKLGERRGSAYSVVPTDRMLRNATVGIARGETPAAVPAYVRLHFVDDSHVSLKELLPDCKEWKRMPNNPDSSAYQYSCNASGSNNAIEVTVFAELNGDLSEPTTQLRSLLLRRDAWR